MKHANHTDLLLVNWYQFYATARSNHKSGQSAAPRAKICAMNGLPLAMLWIWGILWQQLLATASQKSNCQTRPLPPQTRLWQEHSRRLECGSDNPALAAFRTLPAFCRVKESSRPPPTPTLSSRLWLPAEGWNNKYVGVGNGGFADPSATPGWRTPCGSAMSFVYRYGHKAAATDGKWSRDTPKSDRLWIPRHP